MKNKEFILFDFDGTLFDSQIGIKNAVRYALAQEDIYQIEDTVLTSFIGPPLHQSFAEHFGFTKEKIDLVVKNLRVYYSEMGYQETVLYEGIEDLLKGLKSRNKTLAIATAKPTQYALQILKNFGLSEYFYSVQGSSSRGELFPKERVIDSVLTDLNLFDTQDCVMIGDTI